MGDLLHALLDHKWHYQPVLSTKNKRYTCFCSCSVSTDPYIRCSDAMNSSLRGLYAMAFECPDCDNYGCNKASPRLSGRRVGDVHVVNSGCETGFIHGNRVWIAGNKYDNELDSDSELLRKVFRCFDENNDGILTLDEISRFLEKLGLGILPDELASLVLQTVATKNPGSLSFTDFVLLFDSLSNNGSIHVAEKAGRELETTFGEEEEELLEAFGVFDQDGDGFISPSELRSVLNNIGMVGPDDLAVCEEMIRRVDLDGNGQVDYLEFKQMMRNG